MLNKHAFQQYPSEKGISGVWTQQEPEPEDKMLVCACFLSTQQGFLESKPWSCEGKPAEEEKERVGERVRNCPKINRGREDAWIDKFLFTFNHFFYNVCFGLKVCIRYLNI